MSEFLDIVNEENIPTGEVVDRITAHEKGLFHRHVSCWIMNKEGKISKLDNIFCTKKSRFFLDFLYEFLF